MCVSATDLIYKLQFNKLARAFDWLIRKGLVFYWGTSEWTAEQIA